MSQPADNTMQDTWFATNGVVHVGPTSFEGLGRELAQGQLAADAFVRHSSWRVWRRMGELLDLSWTGRQEAMRNLGEMSAGIGERASGPYSQPPPPPSSAELRQPANDSAPSSPRSSLRPTSVDPVGLLGAARDLDAAQLLTLSTAVAAASAQVGLLHSPGPGVPHVVTTAVHGAGTELLLGERIAEDDPTLLAARSGCTLVGEPNPGEAGRYIAGRIGRCLAQPR
ncbi:MAG TPA: hypothetical protein VF989_13765, partial [Polyangiaceae bacterium]